MLYVLFIKDNKYLLKISLPLLLLTSDRKIKHKALPEDVKILAIASPCESKKAQLLLFNYFSVSADRPISLNDFLSLVFFPISKIHFCLQIAVTNIFITGVNNKQI